MFFTHKTKQILEEMSGEKAIMALDNLLTPIFYKSPNKLTEQEKMIVYIEELEREVNNGGFNQFFFNSSGNYTDGVVQALKNIGSIKFLNLVESAIAQFPNSEVPKNRQQRQAILEKIDGEANPIWNTLNKEFYKYEEDIYGLLRAYISKNIKHFR